MKKIELTQGQIALVDDVDYEALAKFNWYAKKCRNAFYAMRNERLGLHWITVQMHRVVLGAPDGVDVDHVDGNGLNNQRANLRLATNAQNMHNRGRQANNTSGYKGVTSYSQYGKWLARIRIDGHLVYLGYYTNPIDAARAYDAAATKFHGEFARLNFPEAR